MASGHRFGPQQVATLTSAWGAIERAVSSIRRSWYLEVSVTEVPHPQTAVLLIAHGSRRVAANDDLVELARLVKQRNQYSIVEVSYLELTSPTIPEGGRTCVARGARQVLMLPYFLSAGVHVVNDLESHRGELAAEFPEVEFRLCPHLGLHPLMAEIVLHRLQEGVPGPDSAAYDPAGDPNAYSRSTSQT